jgi:hypothetical protein
MDFSDNALFLLFIAGSGAFLTGFVGGYYIPNWLRARKADKESSTC